MKMISIARLKWLRHTARKQHDVPCRKITSQPEGGRKKGRPRLRWLDSVLKDLKTLEVKAWWKTCSAEEEAEEYQTCRHIYYSSYLSVTVQFVLYRKHLCSITKAKRLEPDAR